MRVMVMSTPFPSHLLPLVPLMWALRAAGHDVLVVGQPDLRGAVAGAGMCGAFVGHPFHPEDTIRRSLPDGVRPLRQLGTPTPEAVAASGKIWATHARYLLPEYLDFARSWRPDLIVSEQLEFAGLIVGADLGVPVVQHRWGVDPLDGGARGAARSFLAGACERLGLSTLPEPALLLDPCPPDLQLPGVVSGEPVRYVPHNGVGVAHPELLRASDRPRVLVSLGTQTLAANGVPLFRTIIEALRGIDDVRAVVTADPSYHAALGPVPANVRLVAPTPLNLFLHTCAAVIHHGGANTSMTATAAGRPQLVMPQIADQFAHADRISATGAGIALPTAAEQDDVATVRAAVRTIVDDSTYSKQAEQLADAMRAMPSPIAVAARLGRDFHA
jgi:UDP:flavonoid glycosyltransferase YjiC (YdhE family)